MYWPQTVFCRLRDFQKHQRNTHVNLKNPMEQEILKINYSDDLKYVSLLCKNRFRQKRFLTDHLRFEHDNYTHKV